MSMHKKTFIPVALTFFLLAQNSSHGDSFSRFPALNSDVSQVTAVVENRFDSIENMKFSPNGKTLATAHSNSWITVAKRNGFNGGLNIWNSSTLKHVNNLDGHQRGVSGLAFSDDGKLLISASSDHTIRSWDMESMKAISVIEDVPRFYRDVAILPSDGTLIAAGSDRIGGKDDSFMTFLEDIEAKVEKALERGREHADTVLATELQRFYKEHVESPPSEYYLQRRHPDTGEVILSYTGHKDSVTEIELSPDGETFASASLDGTLRIWNIETGSQEQLVYEDENGHGLIYGLSYTSDGKKLAFGTEGKLYVIDTGSLEVLVTLDSHYQGAQFLQEDDLLLAYSPGGITIWDLAKEKNLLDLTRQQIGGYLGAHDVTQDRDYLVLAVNGDNDSGDYLIMIKLLPRK